MLDCIYQVQVLQQDFGEWDNIDSYNTSKGNARYQQLVIDRGLCNAGLNNDGQEIVLNM